MDQDDPSCAFDGHAEDLIIVGRLPCFPTLFVDHLLPFFDRQRLGKPFQGSPRLVIASLGRETIREVGTHAVLLEIVTILMKSRQLVLCLGVLRIAVFRKKTSNTMTEAPNSTNLSMRRA